mgnify:CR=1 FL=1
MSLVQQATLLIYISRMCQTLYILPRNKRMELFTSSLCVRRKKSHLLETDEENTFFTIAFRNNGSKSVEETEK